MELGPPLKLGKRGLIHLDLGLSGTWTTEPPSNLERGEWPRNLESEAETWTQWNLDSVELKPLSPPQTLKKESTVALDLQLGRTWTTKPQEKRKFLKGWDRIKEGDSMNELSVLKRCVRPGPGKLGSAVLERRAFCF